MTVSTMAQVISTEIMFNLYISLSFFLIECVTAHPQLASHIKREHVKSVGLTYSIVRTSSTESLRSLSRVKRCLQI